MVDATLHVCSVKNKHNKNLSVPPILFLSRLHSKNRRPRPPSPSGCQSSGFNLKSFPFIFLGKPPVVVVPNSSLSPSDRARLLSSLLGDEAEATAAVSRALREMEPRVALRLLADLQEAEEVISVEDKLKRLVGSME